MNCPGTRAGLCRSLGDFVRECRAGQSCFGQPSGSGMAKVSFTATPYKRQYQLPGYLFLRLADLEFFPIAQVKLSLPHPRTMLPHVH